MKRQIAALLAAAALLLTGCGATAQTDPPTPKTKEQIKADDEQMWEMTIDTQIPEELQAQPHPVADSFAGGTGTEEDPYQIATADQLALMAAQINQAQLSKNWDEVEAATSASYVLTADIDMNDVTDFDSWTQQAPEYLWQPIGMMYDYTLPDGEEAETLSFFTGHFDGQGHTIRGLYIISAYYNTDASNQPYYGLFGNVVDGVVENVTVTDSLYHLLTPVSLHPAGGIVSHLGGRLENCTSDVDIVAQAGMGIGGVAGDLSGGELRGCTFTGSIRAEGKVYYAGGVVATGGGGTVAQCRAAGTLDFAQPSALTLGGVAGEVTDVVGSALLLEDCVNEMDLDGPGIAGSLASLHDGVTIRGCVNKGSATGGGITSRLTVYKDNNIETSGTIRMENCVNQGTVQGEEEQGGLVGTVEMYDAGTGLIVTGCRNEGTVTSPDGAGGLFSTVRAGSDTSVQISDCENTGTVSSDESCVGGVVNTLFVQGGTTGADVLLQNCRNSGQVTGCGYGVGGIFGRQLGRMDDDLTGNTFRLENCENTGAVTGLMPYVYAGGIAGYLPFTGSSTGITACRNSGTVQLYADQPLEDSGDGQQYVQGVIGGIVACAQASTAVQDCSNTGSLEIPQDLASLGYAGDLVGYTFNNGEPILGATGIQDGKAVS